MSSSEKFFKILSSALEKGIITTQDIKKNLKNNFEFEKDKFIKKFDLVTREEFEILKKIVKNQDKVLKKIKKKKIKKVKKP